MRIGIGYDIHRLSRGRRLLLGGVEIPFQKGLLGHSDADVLLHAIIDAMLGAAASGDIGDVFPDTDARYKDISSTLLFKKAVSKTKQKGFSLENIDATIIAQVPYLGTWKEKIRENIADLSGLSLAQVNIKAKTNEGLDATGKKEAIAAWAVVSMRKKTRRKR